MDKSVCVLVCLIYSVHSVGGVVWKPIILIVPCAMESSFVTCSRPASVSSLGGFFVLMKLFAATLDQPPWVQAFLPVFISGWSLLGCHGVGCHCCLEYVQRQFFFFLNYNQLNQVTSHREVVGVDGGLTKCPGFASWVLSVARFLQPSGYCIAKCDIIAENNYILLMPSISTFLRHVRCVY